MVMGKIRVAVSLCMVCRYTVWVEVVVRCFCCATYVGCIHILRSEGKVLFSCSVDGQVVLWSSSNQPYDTVLVRIKSFRSLS